MLETFRSSSADLCIVESQAESRASGVHVGRLNVWSSGAASAEAIRRIISHSDYDVVIIRADASNMSFGADLQCSEFMSWQADTLLYFELSSEREQSSADSVEMRQLHKDDRQLADQLVAEIFADYRNHYSTNIQLAKIDLVDAYQDWTANFLESESGSVWVARNPNTEPVGICVLDESQENCHEIVLAGIVPSQRRMGLYSDMVRAVALRASSMSIQRIVISTQAANVSVMRTWCRLGFVPTRAINTFHVVRKTGSFH